MLENFNTLRRNGWTPWHLLGAVALVVLGAFATRAGWADLWWLAWNDQESSHILLVLPMAAWLVWVRRQRLRLCRPGFSLVGPLLVLAGWAIGETGYREDVRAFEHLGAVLVTMGCVLAVAGRDVFWRFLPAWAVLLLLVPVPYSIRVPIAIPLQRITAQITEGAFGLMGLPIERSGSLLIIQGIEVGIAEACNGMRMVFALLLVCYVFAFSSPLRPYARLMILALSPVAALACNVIRVVPTVYMHGYAPHEWAEAFHDYSGWLMIGVAFLLLLAMLQGLRWLTLPVDRYALQPEGAVA